MMLDMFEVGPCQNAYEMSYLNGQRINCSLSRNPHNPNSQPLITALSEANRKKYPKYWDELTGTADGSGVPILSLILSNFRKEILPFLPKTAKTLHTETPDDCLTVLVLSDSMAIAVHNEDANVALGHTECSPLQKVLQYNFHKRLCLSSRLPNGLSFTSYTYAGELPSWAFGFNSNALAFILNSVPPAAEIIAGGTGQNFVSRDLLEATWMDDALILLNVETASRKRISVHTVEGIPLFHAYMYLHLQVQQVKDDNSISRQRRAAELPKMSQADFLSLLGDTSNKQYPIYMTGPTLYTLCTTVIDLEKQTVSLLQGNPKKGQVSHVFQM
ncbi:hypothetical protein AQUCO_01500452v1 [Aquilegia coerulea]|uniref:Peptidase C45 hydrolase domain-containing protein n=1 Tax=Aquilegia coerulea TaxID=218851 RepID=A0A2G5DTU8_AQUCA|nr:hypothetical protein AQUCO_01500452v1 [Aquilegia coerulea]